jgi:hypothetical protein
VKDDFFSFISRSFRLGKKTPRGFYPLRCPVCRDKKVRAGFKFEGVGFGYNCFRGKCQHKFRWKGGPAGDKMYKLFDAASIPRGDWAHLIDLLPSSSSESEAQPAEVVIKKLSPINLPGGATPLQDCNPEDIRTRWAIEFLLEKIDNPLSYPFFLTHVLPSNGEMDFRNRIIIPIYHQGNLIFYQGRWYNKTLRTPRAKYLNAPGVEREQLLFNMDELDRETESPLLVVEGIFDALMLAGVSCLSNNLTDEQLLLLRRSPRRKLFVPDYNKAGKKLVYQALDNDWDVSFPDWGSCEDLGEAVKRHGKYKTAGMIYEGIAPTRFDIKNFAELKCQG